MDWWSKRTEPSTHALRVRGRPSVTEISPTLLIGEYLRPDDIAWLKAKFGVSAVQNLQDDEDLALHGLRERDLAEAARASGPRCRDGRARASAARVRLGRSSVHGARRGRRATVHRLRRARRFPH